MNGFLKASVLGYFQLTKLLLWLFFIPYYSLLVEYSLGPVWSRASPEYPGSIAPYGVFWYIFYHSMMRTGWVMFGIYMVIFDTIIAVLVFKYQSVMYAFAFSFSSLIFFWYSPGDLFPFWLAVLGKEQPLMSILAVLTKLPWPGPLYAWQFIFSVSLPLNMGFGFWRYALLGLWIIHPVFEPLKAWILG